MGKQKKKRTKKYAGVDASQNRPNVTRVQAVNRSKFGQWRFEHKRSISLAWKTTLALLVIILIISGFMSLFK